MNSRIVHSKVAGVTFENRQGVIDMMQGNEIAQLRPEPTNPYDPNAIAVWIAFPPESKMLPAQIGYIPRELAAEIAPILDDENLICKVLSITGGFDMGSGDYANYGVVLEVEIPDAKS